MPKIPKFHMIKPQNVYRWSPFPWWHPPDWTIPEWKKTKIRGDHKVVKIKHPNLLGEVRPIKNYPIVKGDLVQVMVGRDTGKQGKVRALAPLKNQLKVERLNYTPEFQEDRGDGNPSYVLKEEPLHYYDVKLVDPTTGKPTDVILHNNGGKEVRICKTSGRVIPKPQFEKYGVKSRHLVVDGDSDTKAEDVQECTYIPSLLLFHEEIMMEMNIPMSVSKTSPERRDLIMKEIGEDLELENEDRGVLEELEIKEEGNKSKGFLDYLNFWRRE